MKFNFYLKYVWSFFSGSVKVMVAVKWNSLDLKYYKIKVSGIFYSFIQRTWHQYAIKCSQFNEKFGNKNEISAISKSFV